LKEFFVKPPHKKSKQFDQLAQDRYRTKGQKTRCCLPVARSWRETETDWILGEKARGGVVTERRAVVW